MSKLNFRHKAVMQELNVCEQCIYENDIDCYYKSCEKGVEEFVKLQQLINKKEG